MKTSQFPPARKPTKRQCVREVGGNDDGQTSRDWGPEEGFRGGGTGKDPMPCTQGVKVTFHNTSETGLME